MTETATIQEYLINNSSDHITNAKMAKTKNENVLSYPLIFILVLHV